MVILLDPEKYQLEEHKDEIPKPSITPKKRRRRFSRRTKNWIRFTVFAALSLFALRLLQGHHSVKDLDDIDSPDVHLSKTFGHTLPASPLVGKAAEELFLSIPNAKSALSASRAYATHPHLAGSTEDLDDAKVILELFQTHFGIPVSKKTPIFPAGSAESRNATLDITSSFSPRAWIDVYYPVMNTPLDRSLDILDEDGTSAWSADLVEDGDVRDREAAKYRDYVPTFHGFSYNGEAEGQLVYANYGTKEDYDELMKSGVNLRGKIAIARYGAIVRGLKIKGAQELGAVGVLMYDDPRNDGSATVQNGYKPYPEGPARNPTAVQRGSVQFISMYPGDPTTPGYPSYENTTRTEGTNVPSIPSLPISWSNAERLLEEIAASPDSRTLTGRVSTRKVKIVNHVDTKVTPIWNTMAVIPGHILQEVVVIGNHRDAWVMGAVDPTSGTVSLHEVVRGFGGLIRSGWKPARTIVFASWDAEEYGLIGSTEWGEDFADWISKYVVAYLNLDSSVGGSQWAAAGSPSLAHIIRQTAQDIRHPTKPGKTLLDAAEDVGPFEGPVDPDVLAEYQAAKNQLHTSETGIGILGSGSDFTVFLQRLGVASCDQSFAPTPSDAAYHYHSIYDSQRWQEIYGDPGFHRHVAVAKHLGLLALRIADTSLLPFNTTQYAFELDVYLDKVESVASNMLTNSTLSALRESIAGLQNASLDLDEEKITAQVNFEKYLQQVIKDHGRCRRHHNIMHRFSSWFKSFFGIQSHPKHLPLHCIHPVSAWVTESKSDLSTSSSNKGADSTGESDQFGATALLNKFNFGRDMKRAAKRLRKVNRKLYRFERGFISEEGIKDREWYRHLGVAPGKWLGYGATTFPALTEALTIEKNTTLAHYEAERLRTLIDKLADSLRA